MKIFLLAILWILAPHNITAEIQWKDTNAADAMSDFATKKIIKHNGTDYLATDLQYNYIETWRKLIDNTSDIPWSLAYGSDNDVWFIIYKDQYEQHNRRYIHFDPNTKTFSISNNAILSVNRIINESSMQEFINENRPPIQNSLNEFADSLSALSNCIPQSKIKTLIKKFDAPSK